ncbi:MAG TPA: AAA family ATPase [Verrucomicrobiae bacterium]|jgi:hypothetical protein
MNTRRAESDGPLRQERFASSQEFERGLLAYLVAKRCAIVDSAEDRDLIWFLQYLSHQDGSLTAVAKALREKYADRIQTEEMAEMKLKPGKICNAEQVRKLRGNARNSDYILKGETRDYLLRSIFTVPAKPSTLWGAERIREWKKYREEAQKNPTHYPSDDFFNECIGAAESHLEKQLQEICLNPAFKIEAGQPWYFPRLIETLREYKTAFVEQQKDRVVTALGKKVREVLDYTFYSRGLTLIEGNARMGKSYSARAWCLEHPGQARFVEVPPSNDEAGFFRAIARGLGLGNFLQYKVAEIRERVESVLLSGDLLLVLDEAQRLWPQKNLRYGFPNRVNWVMTMANHNVPICAITTPQFIELQKAAEEKGRWNSAQLIGRICHYEPLPTDLDEADLMAVGKAVLPESSNEVLRALAVYARSSARYLAAIDSIAKRARFISMRAGRADATTADVRTAMKESVIPADSKLLRALASGRKSKTPQPTPVPTIATMADDEPETLASGRENAPARGNIDGRGLGSRLIGDLKPDLTSA